MQLRQPIESSREVPLLLLGGTLCDTRLWDAQRAALGAGCGVGDLTGSATIADLAAQLLAAAPPRFALVGLSFGGIVALEIVRRAPERVVRLALLDTTARAPSQAQLRLWQELACAAETANMRDLVRSRLLPGLLSAIGQADAALVERVCAMAEATGAGAYRRQLAALATRQDSRPWLAQIACPTLVLAGEHDALCPVELHREIAAAIPGAELAIVPSCGHLSPLEAPDAVSAALRRWHAR